VKRPTAFMALFVSVALASPIEALRAQESAAPAGGVYLELRAEQTRLVDDWFAVYNEVTGESMDPRIEYDRLPTAIRTTYEAVTHALMNSPLTAEDGLPLGTALDVVAHVETVTGDVMRSHSDEQFRIYVKLEPDALQRLSASREFTRRGDNTVFHVGYPLNFRQLGGVPSIQVSCARDGTRADIDVDYRSSTFPASLFNGHLTTANSDVRAGSNYTRHRGRWLGLVDWWRSFFDIGPRPEPRVGGPEIVPEFPRHRAGSPLEYVAYDFLATWLVEGTPQDALPYFSPQAYACLDRPGDEGDGIPVGFEMWAILREMHKANDLLGPRATLQDATVGVEPTGPGFRTMHQLHDYKFAQFEIRNDVEA